MAKSYSSFMQGFTEGFVADLGRVVAAWSHIEMHFDMLFLSLVVMRGASSGSTSDPRVGKLMGMDFKRRVSAFRARVDELDIPADTQKAVERALSQLGTLRNERDEVAHSVWNVHISEDRQFSKDRATTLFKSWKNQKPHEFSVVTQDRLKEIFERMEALYWSLVELSIDQRLRAQRPRQP